ncbi:MAG: hypothetical protein WCT39_05745 [Candidatus Margulisiibacteriota bacterium]|jgi:hypothetical protein
MRFKLIALCLLYFVLTSSAHALIGIGMLGAAYNSGGTTNLGYGLECELPLPILPFMQTRLEGIFIPGSGYTAIPINIKETYNFPLTPFFVGFGLGLVLYNRSDAGFTAPTGLNYNGFVGYEQKFTPINSWFVQVGYEAMKIDYKIGSISYATDFSGASVKGGVRLGI